MKEELITYETAVLAKEKGFDIPCSNGWSRCPNLDILLYNDAMVPHILEQPTQALLTKWLREKQNIDIIVQPERYSDGTNYCTQALMFDHKNGDSSENFVVDGTYLFNDNNEYPTYELAVEKALYEGLKLIKL